MSGKIERFLWRITPKTKETSLLKREGKWTEFLWCNRLKKWSKVCSWWYKKKWQTKEESTQAAIVTLQFLLQNIHRVLTVSFSISFSHVIWSCPWGAWFSLYISILLAWICDCTRVKFYMHHNAVAACRLTDGPSTNVFNLTRPLRALRALLAWKLNIKNLLFVKLHISFSLWYHTHDVWKMKSTSRDPMSIWSIR